MIAIEGGCRCGATRYSIAVEAMPPVYCCHCTDCQRWTGSAFSEQAVVRTESLTVTGPVVDYIYENRSGAQSHQRVCSVCHARIFNTNSRLPGMAVVRAGTLDAMCTLEPRAHIWVSSKQPWVVLPDDLPTFLENASPAEFLRIVMS